MLVEVNEEIKTLKDLERLNNRYKDKDVKFELLEEERYEGCSYTLIIYFKGKKFMSYYVKEDTTYALTYAEGYMDCYLKYLEEQL